MNFVAPLLFLQIASSFAGKQGDFGIFQVCNSNSSLRLKCSYAPCLGSPPYQCRLSSLDDPLFSVYNCSHTIHNHETIYGNTTTSYNCTLTRRGRVENRTVKVDYSIKKGKNRILPCPDAACSLQSGSQTSLWALGIALWTLRLDN